MSTLNVGTANATTVNVGAGGIVFSDNSTLSTSPPPPALNDLTDVSAGSPGSGQVLTWNGSNWVNQDPAGGVDVGTSAQRPTSNQTSVIRYNTDHDVWENYFRSNSEVNRAGWYALGGRQLIAHTQVQESIGSTDIRWGGGAGQNNSKYWMYEVAFNFFENPTNDTYWYIRFFDRNNNLSQSGYYYNMESWYANDGVYSRNANGEGQIYLNSTSTYRGASNGEGHHNFMFYMSSAPNDTCNYWSFHWRGGGGAIQEGGNGGHYIGGGAWREGQSPPCAIRGFRLYWNGNSYNRDQGCNSMISVFGISGMEGGETLNGYGNVN